MKATLAVLGGGLVLTVLFTLIPAERTGVPFVPARADEVLERVPPGTKPLSAPGTSVDDAVALARQLVNESNARGGESRLLGRAQAVLAPWWAAADAPPEVVLVRASVKEALGELPDALAELDRVPGAASAALRAKVLTALGRLDEAQAACEPLPPETRAACVARPLALSGHLDDALAGLTAATSAPVRALRGELLGWRGDLAGAEVELRAAAQLEPGDVPTRLLLADLLLATKRPAQVPVLFPGDVAALGDGELLRVVLALAATDDAALGARRAELDQRIAANRQRGEVLHRRDEARYALALEKDAARALELALSCWQAQRDVATAQLVLEAAVAARQPGAATPVVEWLALTKLPTPALHALVKELGP